MSSNMENNKIDYRFDNRDILAQSHNYILIGKILI